MKYIAFLRGINVGGKNRIKMPDLKSIFESLGFKNVSTYVQSGNVVFDCNDAAPEILEKQIEEGIEQNLKLSVKTIIRTQDNLKQVIEDNPFLTKEDIDTSKLHVTLLSTKPESDLGALPDSILEGADKFVISEKEIYLYCPDGYGNTKLNNSFFERKLKTIATTRNWNTIKGTKLIVE